MFGSLSKESRITKRIINYQSLNQYSFYNMKNYRQQMSGDLSDDDSSPKTEQRRRGRPKKSQGGNSGPRQQALFKRNSAALLSCNIFYVSNVLRIIRRPASNKGFLIIEFDEKQFLTSIQQVVEQVGQIPQRLVTLTKNILQCGPIPVVLQLCELLIDISRIEGDHNTVSNHLLRTKYSHSFTLRSIDFTKGDLLARMEPLVELLPIQRSEIREKFEEYLRMVVEIVKREMRNEESDYYDKVIEMIRVNEPNIPLTKPKTDRKSRSEFILVEPKTRKMRRPNPPQ